MGGKRVKKNAPIGRPKRAEYDALVQSLSVRFPPEYIMDKLDRALELAESQNSSRGIVNVLRFIAEYTEGLPVKRVIHSQDGYDKLAELMAAVAEERKLEAESPGVIVIDNPPKELEKFEKRQE